MPRTRLLSVSIGRKCNRRNPARHAAKDKEQISHTIHTLPPTRRSEYSGPTAVNGNEEIFVDGFQFVNGAAIANSLYLTPSGHYVKDRDPSIISR
jgi:hypothetical protein